MCRRMKRCSVVAWNPVSSTQLVVACEDDLSPILQARSSLPPVPSAWFPIGSQQQPNKQRRADHHRRSGPGWLVAASCVATTPRIGAQPTGGMISCVVLLPQVWDLRNIQAPLRELLGHEKVLHAACSSV